MTGFMSDFFRLKIEKKYSKFVGKEYERIY